MFLYNTRTRRSGSYDDRCTPEKYFSFLHYKKLKPSKPAGRQAGLSKGRLPNTQTQMLKRTIDTTFVFLMRPQTSPDSNRDKSLIETLLPVMEHFYTLQG